MNFVPKFFWTWFRLIWPYHLKIIIWLYFLLFAIRMECWTFTVRVLNWIRLAIAYRRNVAIMRLSICHWVAPWKMRPHCRCFWIHTVSFITSRFPKTNRNIRILFISIAAMAASVIFLMPTILVYLLIKELRSNLRGKLLICYLFSMASAYMVISYINITEVKLKKTPCSIMGK